MNFFVDSAAKNNLDVNGQIIEKVGSCKYLGILFIYYVIVNYSGLCTLKAFTKK